MTGTGVLTGGVATGTEGLAALLRARPVAPARGRRVEDAQVAALLEEGEARRLTRICRFAVAAARLALRDAGLDTAAGLGLVLGSEHGDFHSTIAFADGYLEGGPAGLSALLFPSTVMNTMAAAATIAVGAREACLTFNAPTVPGQQAVARAAAAVAAGRLPAALAGGADEIVELVQAALETFESSEPRGEGSAYVVLEPLASARARHAPILGEILAAACAALPARPGGVGRRASAPAVARALEQAGLTAADLGFAYTGHSGDAARDAWERAILEPVLPRHLPPPVALTDWVGQQAAVGPLAVAAAAWTARTGLWPGGGRIGSGSPGLVHSVARGGSEVALVIGPPPAP